MAKRITITFTALAVAALSVHGDIVPPPTEQPAEGAVAAAPSVPAQPDAGILDSRLLTGPVDSQLTVLRTRISINAKEQGPFGFFQDPEKAAKQVIDIPISKQSKAVRTPLRDVVQAIPISMVIPSTQEFLVNSRTIRTGNQFPLVLGNQSITVRVEKIRSTGVVFRDVKTGELAEKRMEFDPEGVIRSNGGEILPDGIIPAGRSSSEELIIDPTKINPNHNGGSR